MEQTLPEAFNWYLYIWVSFTLFLIAVTIKFYFDKETLEHKFKILKNALETSEEQNQNKAKTIRSQELMIHNLYQQIKITQNGWQDQEELEMKEENMKDFFRKLGNK